MAMAETAGLCKPVNGTRQSPRQHFRDGVCLAALRAFTGAELCRERKLTLGAAALRCGSNVAYIRAALILLEHGDQDLIDQVLRGECSILDAAASVEHMVRLVNAFLAAPAKARSEFFAAAGMADVSTPAKRLEVASRLGIDTIWDDMIAPLVSSSR
jgi:hypothetical protein